MKEVCKYILPCGRCDKFNTSCDLSYADIKLMSEMNEGKCECEHEWYQYVIDLDKERTYIAHICSKCGKATIKRT